VLGKKVYSAEIVTNQEKRMVIQPEKTLAPGVYSVELEMNKMLLRKKLIVK
jgi:hypothetical protein